MIVDSLLIVIVVRVVIVVIVIMPIVFMLVIILVSMVLKTQLLMLIQMVRQEVGVVVICPVIKTMVVMVRMIKHRVVQFIIVLKDISIVQMLIKVPVVLLWMGQVVIIMVIVVKVPLISVIKVVLTVIMELLMLLFIICKALVNIVLVVIDGLVVGIKYHIITFAHIPKDVSLTWVEWCLIFPVVDWNIDSILLLARWFLCTHSFEVCLLRSLFFLSNLFMVDHWCVKVRLLHVSMLLVLKLWNWNLSSVRLCGGLCLWN